MPDTPRIAFFCPIWAKKGPLRLGWSDYWRLALPAVELHRNGWDVVLGRAIGPGEDGRLAVKDLDGIWREDRDVLVFSRWMSKHAPELLRQAREAGQVLVNDLDDLFWGLPPEHPVSLCTDPERDPDYNRENYRATFPESSLITVSTPRLAEVASDWGPAVRVIRNRIDLDAWPERPPGRYVGWVGSTAGRESDLEVLRAVVPWLREHDEPFYHGGRVPGEPRMADVLGYENVVERAAQPIGTYPRLWDPLRLALCPLGPSDFSQAKSWVKPLEACARGIPFIASDQPEYYELGAGRLAASPEEWVRHLKALEDPVTQAADCKTNRKSAEQLTIAEGWAAWADVLREATSPAEERTVVA